ncbi:hypothetical protein ALC60_10093 [Trachymyrmex zeteki]|uniref:Uncharacterized protein n=1 Tax=Mycetomoellerius zeteki TaxID=64791 RepID=A0A151WSZ6_9HYME|nr:hypothetical protein ALC60_10093 [Trachymyrmex zeteki]
MRPERIDALKYTVEYAHTHVCEQKSARGKIIIILRKQSTLIRSFASSQILCARDNYANTFPRWLVLRADNDKTQILTPAVLKRENKGNSETKASGTRAENIEKKTVSIA